MSFAAGRVPIALPGARSSDGALAYRSGAHSMAAIGKHFAVHYMTVSRAVRKYEVLQMATDALEFRLAPVLCVLQRGVIVASARPAVGSRLTRTFGPIENGPVPCCSLLHFLQHHYLRSDVARSIIMRHEHCRKTASSHA